MKCRHYNSTFVPQRVNLEDWLSVAGRLVGFDFARVDAVRTSNTMPELNMKLPRFIPFFYYEIAFSNFNVSLEFFCKLLSLPGVSDN